MINFFLEIRKLFFFNTEIYSPQAYLMYALVLLEDLPGMMNDRERESQGTWFNQH